MVICQICKKNYVCFCETEKDTKLKYRTCYLNYAENKKKYPLCFINYEFKPINICSHKCYTLMKKLTVYFD